MFQDTEREKRINLEMKLKFSNYNGYVQQQCAVASSLVLSSFLFLFCFPSKLKKQSVLFLNYQYTDPRMTQGKLGSFFRKPSSPQSKRLLFSHGR